MTTLVLVRHGESEANRKGVFAGHHDVELQDNGVEQAKLTAKYIKENYDISKVYASDLKRAYITGETIARECGVEIESDSNLREIYSAKWDGVKFEDILEKYQEDYSVWINDIGNSRTTEGESVKELGERIMGALLKIAKENHDKTVAIATHATPIRVAQSLVQTGGLDEMKNIPWVSNASVSVLQYDDGKWEFVRVSEDSHLGGIKTSLPANV